MKLKEQVCSLELAIRIKELGVMQDSLFYISEYDQIISSSKYYEFEGWCDFVGKPIGTVRERYYSAFTVAELGVLLPEGFLTTVREDRRYYIHGHWSSNPKSMTYPSGTEADARAKMLIYLLENKIINVTKE